MMAKSLKSLKSHVGKVSAPFARGLLSDGKVKEHLEYLDSQVRRQVEHLSDQAWG